MTIAFHRFIGVIIGGLIGFFITATVFPLNPRKAVQKKIQTAMFICSDILTALLRNQETVHVQGEIQKGLGGHRQLMRDIADYNINSKDKQLMIIFSSIQDCFEQFIRIKELSPNINANPLCLMLQRDLKFVTLKMPALFEALADDVSHKAINRLNVEILMNKFAKTIQAYREKRITTNYTFEQVKTYSSYVSVINHLFQSLIRLKLSILT